MYLIIKRKLHDTQHEIHQIAFREVQQQDPLDNGILIRGLYPGNHLS